MDSWMQFDESTLREIRMPPVSHLRSRRIQEHPKTLEGGFVELHPRIHWIELVASRGPFVATKWKTLLRQRKDVEKLRQRKDTSGPHKKAHVNMVPIFIFQKATLTEQAKRKN
jgi:hypothetical protein